MGLRREQTHSWSGLPYQSARRSDIETNYANDFLLEHVLEAVKIVYKFMNIRR